MRGALLSQVWKKPTPKVRLYHAKSSPTPLATPSSTDMFGFRFSNKDMLFVIMVSCVLLVLMVMMSMQQQSKLIELLSKLN